MGLILLYVAIRPSVYVENQMYDYGIIGKNKANTGTIIIENKGLLPLKIKSIEGCCGLKIISESKKALKKGEIQKISFVYNSSEVNPGRFNKTVTVDTNDLLKKSIVIPVTGEVKLKENLESSNM